MFNEITAMKGFIRAITPYIKDDLGVLISPDGDQTEYPAIMLSDSTTVPSSTYPRITISYTGSPDDNYITQKVVREEINPDYDEDDEDSQEKLYFIDYKTHINYALTLFIEAGDSNKVLTEERISANTLGRKIRQLLKIASVRDLIHENMDSGIVVVIPEVSNRDADGTILTNSSSVTLTFSTLDVITEQVDGVIESVSYEGTLKRIDETDPDPIETSKDVIAPDDYIQG